MWSALAPSMVAISTTALAFSASGSIFVIFASLAARSISSIRSRSLLLPAGPSVPSPTATPAARISATGETPLAIIMLLDGLCTQPTCFCARVFSIGRVHENAVRGYHVRAEQADLVQILHRRHSVLLLAVFPFFFHFRSVNQDGRVIFPRQRRGILQRLLRAGVDRMGRHRGMNQGIALPLLQELLGVGEHFSFALVVGRGKIDESFAQHAAHAGGFGFFRHGVFEVIHVGESGDAPANLFRRRQTRAPADELLVHVLGFRRENVFVEPVVESHVIVQAAKQGHGDVSVAVDESGQDELAFGIDRLRGGVPGFEFGCGGRPRRSCRPSRPGRRRRGWRGSRPW